MEGYPSQKKAWVLTPEAFEMLLAQLDPERERAGEKYENIRQKLLKFFQWRECPRPEEFTDQTIDRVARRIHEGAASFEGREPYLYFHGVALNVLREHWKEPVRELTALDTLPPAAMPHEQPEEAAERQDQQREWEQRLHCLDECLAQLPRDSLNLIKQYHADDGGPKIEQRKKLARRLKIPLNALRIRAYRIRSELEACIAECVKNSAAP